jgi:type III pantothenate kinase
MMTTFSICPKTVRIALALGKRSLASRRAGFGAPGSVDARGVARYIRRVKARPRAALLLLDIGNTHTHLGLATTRRVTQCGQFKTAEWFDGGAAAAVRRFLGKSPIDGAALCSVVPQATGRARELVWRRWRLDCLELTPATVAGIGIDYPAPETIGPDRLANAIALRDRFGVPSVAVDFGTAVTFDVLDRRGCYVGGIIAPGLAAMTGYLHEKTALLPHIRIRETDAVIGKSTEEAMLVGAVHGYRGLIRGLLGELRRTLRCPGLPVVATGGYAALIAARLPEITAVEPLLTLQGLRLAWLASNLHSRPARETRATV